MPLIEDLNNICRNSDFTWMERTHRSAYWSTDGAAGQTPRGREVDVEIAPSEGMRALTRDAVAFTPHVFIHPETLRWVSSECQALFSMPGHLGTSAGQYLCV